MGNFLPNLDHAHIAKPTLSGKNRLAGIDINKECTRQVAAVLLAISTQPGSFTIRDLSNAMAQRFDPYYSCRNASYDIRKIMGKSMVRKINRSIRYELTEDGIKNISAILCILAK